MLYLYNMSIHDQFDATFKALASPIRRQILDDLKDQPLTTGALCGHFADIDRCTVMQHLKVLEDAGLVIPERSEEHTSELQSLMRISYAVFCLKKKNTKYTNNKKQIRLVHTLQSL